MRISDWSSDVCSSDLLHDRAVVPRHRRRQPGKAACGGGHPLDPVTWSGGRPQPPGLLAPSSSGNMWARMKKICEATKTKVRARMPNTLKVTQKSVDWVRNTA